MDGNGGILEKIQFGQEENHREEDDNLVEDLSHVIYIVPLNSTNCNLH